MNAINGTVTDSVTGLPLKAKVFISGFDMDSSEVYSDSLFGKYYRMIIAGNYNITYSSPGYNSKTVNGVHAANDSLTIQNVQLSPLIIGITNNENNAGKFRLNQNYPNPFNPVTKIKFDLPKQGFVTLKIYDILGSEITTLVNEQLRHGTYEVEFDGTSLPCGVYFYRLQAGDYTDTKKLILLK